MERHSFSLSPQIARSETRRALARRVSADCFWLLIVSYFIGAKMLAFFGVSLPVVQVGGGLMLISIGWSMLGNKPADAQQSVPSTDPFSRAFYPLTMPLTVGPGSIAVAVTLGANNAHHYGFDVLIIIAATVGLICVVAPIYLCYAFANRLVPKLGTTGMGVMVRLSSFLLICIGRVNHLEWRKRTAFVHHLPGSITLTGCDGRVH